MISIYKVSKEEFKTIFAIDFLEEKASFFFFVDGEWEEDYENVDTESMEFIYGELVDVNLLHSLDLGEKIDLPEGGSISCLANVPNLGSLEETSENVINFLDSYAKMVDMV